MRLAIFDIISHLGGAQRSMTEFAIALHHMGHEVCFIDAYGFLEKHESWVRQAGLQYVVLCRNAKFVTIGYENKKFRRLIRVIAALPEFFTACRQLRSFLKTNKFENIVVTNYKSLTILFYSVLRIKINIIFWLRGCSISSSFINNWYSDRIDKYICLSNSIVDKFVDAGIPRSKIAIVPNAIEIEKLSELSVLALNSFLPDREKLVKLLVPATLLPTKGQDCAIRVLAYLIGKKVDAVLYLAGDSALSGSNYKNQLIDLSRFLGVSDRVHFLGWRDDIPQIMRQSSVILLPSHAEGIPRCIMEAMALKIPVVATAVGGIPEMLDNGEGGTLVEIDDFIGMAESILHGLKGSFIKKVDYANNLAISRFDRESQIKKFLEIVEDIS